MKNQKKSPQLNLKIQPEKLKFGEHLHELKNRFLVWFVSFSVASFVGYLLYQPILSWLIIPLKGPLFYTSPVGALQTVFSICVLFGFIFSLPILLYQIIKFFEPAVEKKLNNIVIYVLLSLFLAVCGVLVSYYLVLPATLKFLSTFSGGELKALISTHDYFSFISKYLLGFALLFQLPLGIYILGKFIPLQSKTLLKYWRQVIVISFIISAVLTPTPDPVNQLIMASPIIILYFISIAVLVLGKKMF